MRTGTLCSHIVKVSAGVCFVKVDLHQFYLSGGSQDKCDMDWFSVIGAYGGHQEDMKTKLATIDEIIKTNCSKFFYI